ncbi:large ribosomal subunit protein mL43 [Anabrus simplex]|uniref:large ribosomal subunit protein mL43 n=1 Tax=Anabrus simplex TaxID=316456 RepID=UPI0034DD62E7
MSNSHLFMLAGFPRAPLQNGLGRWICQLQRITFKFCKHHGTSRGMREFLELDLLDFAKQYPGIVVYVKPRRHRLPNLTAEYLNGGKEVINCRNFTREEIGKWLHLLRTQSGRENMRFIKMFHTDHPSIQGVWNPFVHKDPKLNLVEFPSEELSRPVHVPPSATEQLLEMFKKQQQDTAILETKRAE